MFSDLVASTALSVWGDPEDMRELIAGPPPRRSRYRNRGGARKVGQPRAPVQAQLDEIGQRESAAQSRSDDLDQQKRVIDAKATQRSRELDDREHALCGSRRSA